MQEWLEKTGSLFERAFISGDRWKLYIEGLGVTVEIAFFAAILGLIIGTIVALMKMTTARSGKKTIHYSTDETVYQKKWKAPHPFIHSPGLYRHHPRYTIGTAAPYYVVHRHEKLQKRRSGGGIVFRD